MSEHAWTQEHIAVAVAGGLDAADAEQFDAHVRDCPACAAALADARALDRGLSTLFTAARPGPAAEDRLIRSLWAAPAPRAPRSGRFWPKILWGVAASVGLGLTGAGMSLLAGDGGLMFPGADVPITSMSPFLDGKKNPRSKEQIAAMSLENPDIGIDPDASTRYKLDRIEDVSVPGPVPADSTKSRSSRESHTLRTPEAMAQQLSQRTLSGTTFGTVLMYDDSESSKQSGSGLGSGTAANGTMGGRSASLTDGEKRKSHMVDGTSNSVLFSEGKPQTPSMMPPPPVTSPPVAVLASPDGRAVASSSGGEPTVRVWDTQTGHHPPALGFTFKPADHTWKDQPPASGDPNSHTYSVPITPTKTVPHSGGYKADPKPSVPPPHPPAVVNPAPQPPNTPSNNPPAPETPVVRKIIRSGDIEFEIESFDPAVATVTQLVNKIKGGYIATVNSEKLANGKVRGSIVVRVPPDALDNLVLDLRKELGKGGELKGQKIGSQDITKQYYDLESRLKAARTMEQRLLQIIKDGKGEIKQLLEAEKELGVWRTRIEEFEGELRYFANQVTLSTLTITLAEKEIKAAAGLTETEVVKTGVEVEDVDKALQDAIAAVTAAKGRITKSELKQLAAGQFNAILNFEVAPDAAGPLRDRLRQIGRMARLEIDRQQTAEGGTPRRDAKVKRGDAQFFVQLYNLVAIAPRETAVVTVAATDVAAAYQALRDAVGRAKGRVLDAKVNEQDRQNVTAQIDFEVRRGDEATVQAALAAAGDVIARNVARAQEGENVTDAKVRFNATLISATRLRPRETATLGIEVENVDVTAAAFAAQMAAVQGRTVEAHITHERNGRVIAHLVYDVPLASAAGLAEQFKSAGTVRVLSTARDAQAPEGKLAVARLDVTLSNADLIVPKDDGLWPQVVKGLSYSARFLMFSVTWLIVGACVVVPWALVGYGGYRLMRRLFRPSAPAA